VIVASFKKNILENRRINTVLRFIDNGFFVIKENDKKEIRGIGCFP